MANPIGRYRPPYPTREELLGLTNRNPDPSPTLQIAPLSKPEQDSQQSLREPPPVPPHKDNVPPLPRKDSLSPTRWNEDRSSERAFEAVDAQSDSPSGKTKPWSLVEEIRQRRSEKRLKPVGPPNLSLSEANNNTATSDNVSPRTSTERPLPALPALPVQPTLQQLPPRNANLPGRQIKPLVEPLQKPKADEMGSSKSKPVPPESSTSVPRRPLQSSTLPRTIQANPQKVGSAPATSGREDRQPKSEGNTMRPAEYTQKRLEVSTPMVLAPPVKDLHFPITKVSPVPSTTAAEAPAIPYHGVQRSQPAEPMLLPSQIPPSKPSESYSVASNLKSSASRPRQNPRSENANLFRGRDPEEYENDKLVTVPSPSNYTDNSASVSPLKDSNDSITPPSSYPDEDDRPLTPLNAPPAGKSIIWNLNTVQYRCYVEHRNMKLSRNERHPMPCMLCNVADQEPRRKCTWCCLRICKGCHWLLTEACGRSVESLIGLLAREGKTGDEVREKTEGVSNLAGNV
ncbi:MAG: hypothetical protein M1839_008480 [Geoglossum umbratile]|nr:MAG: hypothetical protein M1839_008480 [Geoglossum umbratile]